MFRDLFLCYHMMDFVIFMDAYMNYIWIFSWVGKSDVFNSFHLFQAQVERHFSLKIQYVQIDQDGGYWKQIKYFKIISIHYHFIFPHTHEKNGMVERQYIYFY